MTWIPLLVEEADYAEFAEEVRRRHRARAADGEAPAPGPPRLPGPVDLTATARSSETGRVVEAELATLAPWEPAHLEQLARGDYETTRRWARAMDVCARHMGEFLSTEQVATEAGMPIEHWRDAPRKITRHLERHYDGVPGWPLRAIDGRMLGNPGQTYWAINAEQARRWTTVRGTASAG